MSAAQSQRTWAFLAAGAAVVLIASMFVEWYTVDPLDRIPQPAADLPTFTGFKGLERAVAVVVAAALAIVIALAVLAGVLASSSAPGIALIAVSLFALAVVLYRGVMSPPGRRSWGSTLR
jgi:hypothetical protein